MTRVTGALGGARDLGHEPRHGAGTARAGVNERRIAESSSSHRPDRLSSPRSTPQIQLLTIPPCIPMNRNYNDGCSAESADGVVLGADDGGQDHRGTPPSLGGVAERRRGWTGFGRHWAKPRLGGG